MNPKIVKNFLTIIAFSVISLSLIFTFNTFPVKVSLTNGTQVPISVKVQHSDSNLKLDPSNLVEQRMEEINAGETKNIDLFVARKTAYIVASDIRDANYVKLDSMRYRIPNNADNLIFKLNEAKNSPILVENLGNLEELETFESEENYLALIANQIENEELEAFESEENHPTLTENQVKNGELEAFESEEIHPTSTENPVKNEEEPEGINSKNKNSSLFSIKNLIKLGSAGALGYICYKIYNSQYKQDSSESKNNINK